MSAAPFMYSDTWPIKDTEDNRLVPGETYEALDDNVAVMVVIYHKSGDFRGSVAGKVKLLSPGGQTELRGWVSAGWAPAFGFSAGSFVMFVSRSQSFKVFVTDDFAGNFGASWGVVIRTSQAVRKVSGASLLLDDTIPDIEA